MEYKLKFRGKRVENKEWIQGYVICLENNGEKAYFILPENFKIDWHGKHPGTQILENFCQVFPETVGRCIGLKDKNNKEIYEGDIIRRLCDIFDDSERNATVEWDYGTASYIFRDENGKHWINFKSNIDSNIEVIGNIYENPELLK